MLMKFKLVFLFNFLVYLIIEIRHRAIIFSHKKFIISYCSKLIIFYHLTIIYFRFRLIILKSYFLSVSRFLLNIRNGFANKYGRDDALLALAHVTKGSMLNFYFFLLSTVYPAFFNYSGIPIKQLIIIFMMSPYSNWCRFFEYIC